MPSSIIVAQGPMEDTVADFLHMLYQKQVQTVFMLSNCTENDKVSLTKSKHILWGGLKMNLGLSHDHCVI